MKEIQIKFSTLIIAGISLIIIIILFYQSIKYPWLSIRYLENFFYTNDVYLAKETYTYNGEFSSKNGLVNPDELKIYGNLYTFLYFSYLLIIILLLTCLRFTHRKWISLILIAPVSGMMAVISSFFFRIYNQMLIAKQMQENLFYRTSYGIQVEQGFWFAIIILFIMSNLSILMISQYYRDISMNILDKELFENPDKNSNYLN